MYKIGTQEELKEALEEYKGILSNSIIDFLESLIGLEFSVIQNHIGAKDYKAISELALYKHIAIYNIYQRALQLFEHNKDLTIYDNETGLDVFVSGSNRARVYTFDYRNAENNMPFDYRNLQIGRVSLQQRIESKEYRDKEIERLQTYLENLKKEKNPYSANPELRFNWIQKQTDVIYKTEEKIQQLMEFRATGGVKRGIEITNQMHASLLEDYGLDTTSFREETQKSYLKRTLVKKQSNIIITDTTTYL